MRRIQKVMAGIFLGGVLLGGIGTGLALVEYSSLTYGGEHLVGEEYLVTRNLDFEFEPDGKILILPSSYYMNGRKNARIEADEKIPAGTIRYEITYNEKSVTPWLGFEPYEEAEGSGTEAPDGEETSDAEETVPGEKEEKKTEYLGRLYLETYDSGNEFALFMENKDRFLKELKERKISSYREAYITDIIIKVNPETLPFIESRNRWD